MNIKQMKEDAEFCKEHNFTSMASVAPQDVLDLITAYEGAQFAAASHLRTVEQQAGEINPPEFPKYPAGCDGWSREHLWAHACLTGWRLAAPISEGTGNLIGMEVSMDVSTGENDGTNRVFGRVEGVQAGTDGKPMILAVEESRNFPAAPAASNGNALPSLPEPAFIGKHEDYYSEIQMEEFASMCIKNDRAARAGTGSAGSIGEDAEFNRLVMCIAAAAERKGGYPKERQDLVAYIDTRALKVEAAPGNAGRDFDALVDIYSQAWSKSFHEANPFDSISPLSADLKIHIKAGLQAAITALGNAGEGEA